MPILEMIPREYWLQLHRELLPLVPELLAEEQAAKEATGQTKQATRERKANISDEKKRRIQERNRNRREYQRRWQQEHREHLKAYQREWRARQRKQ